MLKHIVSVAPVDMALNPPAFTVPAKAQLRMRTWLLFSITMNGAELPIGLLLIILARDRAPKFNPAIILVLGTEVGAIEFEIGAEVLDRRRRWIKSPAKVSGDVVIGRQQEVNSCRVLVLGGSFEGGNEFLELAFSVRQSNGPGAGRTCMVCR